MPPDWASAPSVHDNGGLSERESLVQGARSEEPQDVEAGVPTGDEVREALRVLRESTAEARRNAEAMQLREQRARFFLTMFIVFIIITMPPVVLLWVIIATAFFAPCARIIARFCMRGRTNAPAGTQDPATEALAERMPPRVLRVIGSQRGRELNAANLRLMMLDRDFSPEDFDLLLALDRVQDAVDSHARRNRDEGAVREALEGIAHGPFCIGKGGAGEDGPSCVVCLEDLKEGEDVATLRCAHQFHYSCIKEWIETRGVEASCPICKYPLVGEVSGDAMSEEGGDAEADVEEGGVRAA